MTESELYALARDIRYQGQPCMRIYSYDPGTMERCPPGYLFIQYFISACAVEDGSPCRISSGGYWSIRDLERSTVESIVVHSRDAIQGLQCHEVNETLTYQGVRYFDPHRLGVQMINLRDHVCPSAELTSAPVLDDGLNAEEKAALEDAA